MTLDETRQLGIEFERRVQTMIPEKEFQEKLDTQTIYSYLNQAQDRYIHDIYRNLDKIQSGSKVQSHIDATLQSLLREDQYDFDDAVGKNIDGENITLLDTVVSTGRSVTYALNPSFYMYIRSVSKVSKTFSFRTKTDHGLSPIRILPNQLVSQNDVWKLLETPHNSLRILRYPAAVLTPHNNNYEGNPTITIIYDQYTQPEGFAVTYYAQPKHFDIMTSTACELPIDAFEELVSSAVDLYVSYVAGAEARRRQMDEARR